MLLINVILLLLLTIGSQLDLIVASGSFLKDQSIVQLLQQSEINLANGLTSDWIDSTSTSNQVNYSSSWLIGDNLRCTVKLVTDYDSLEDDYNQTNPINQLIVWYQVKDSPSIQLWIDSNEKLDLFSREYLIDLPLIRKDQFRLLINFQSSRSLNYVPQLIKTLEIDRCWHTYQPCPVLSCLTNGTHNGVSCTFNPTLSFNCSTKGLCIHQDEVCDYEINCPDGSDEANCDPLPPPPSKQIVDSSQILNSAGVDVVDDNYLTKITNNSDRTSLRCSFEVDHCFWKPVVIRSTSESCFRGNCSHDRGLLRTVAVDSLIKGPTFDHTLGTFKGHYLLLNATNDKLGKSSGCIGTGTPIGGHCKLIFYYLTNSRLGQVLIRSSENSSSLNPFSTIEVIDLDADKSLYTRVEVEIDLAPNGEWLFLVAMVKGYDNSYLAIDDIYFTKGCFPVSNLNSSPFNSTSSSSTTTTSTVIINQ